MSAAAKRVSLPARTNTSASPSLRPLGIPQTSKRAVEDSTALSLAPCWHFTQKIEHRSRTFELARPLAIRLQQDCDRVWEASVSSLGIFATGNSSPLAFDELQEEFAAIWDALAFEDDANLTEDAIQLKRTLRQLVRAN